MFLQWYFRCNYPGLVLFYLQGSIYSSTKTKGGRAVRHLLANNAVSAPREMKYTSVNLI